MQLWSKELVRPKKTKITHDKKIVSHLTKYQNEAMDKKTFSEE